MEELFEWMDRVKGDLHPLILYSVSHYDFLFIDAFVVQVGDSEEWLTEYVEQLLEIRKYDTPYTRNALMQKLELKSKESFCKNYLHPALKLNLVKRTMPDKPNSKNQRYVKV